MNFNCYIFKGERTVALWRVEGEDTAMEKALAINDSVSMLDIVEEEEGEEAVVAVVTAAGMLKLYKPKLEASGKKQKKPLKPWKSLTVAAEQKDAKGRVGQIPVMAARLNKQNGVAVGYGLAARPVLERLQVWICFVTSCWSSSYIFDLLSVGRHGDKPLPGEKQRGVKGCKRGGV